MGSAFFGFGGPPKPAPGSDPWGQGIANLVGAWLQSQPTLLEQEEAKQRQALMGAHADLYKTEAALKALDLHERGQKQTAMQDFLSRYEASERQESPSFVGPPNPSVTRPTPMEGLAAGFNPKDLAQVGLLSEAMKPTPDDNRLRILSTAGYKPVSNNQSVSSAELRDAQALELQKQNASRETELEKARIQAGATLGAARIRGPSGGGGDRFQIIDSQDQDGHPIKLRVNPQTGQAEPLMMGGQTVMGKAADKHPTEAQSRAYEHWARGTQALEDINKVLEEGYVPGGFDSVAQNYLPSLAGQPLTSKQGQLYHNAEAILINVIKRRDSGQAVNAQERLDFRKDFGAQPGDTPELRAQKAASLNLIIDSLAETAMPLIKQGPHYNRYLERSGKTGSSTGDKSVTLRQAREALAAGKDRKSVEDRLRSYGIDPKELAP